MSLTIPLFPLNTVLFPGGVLPLRIFEPRYLDMVSNCLKNNLGIGVILIKEGSETGSAAEVYDVGTLTNICYWNKRPDGLLGITLRGEQRFKILSQQVEPSQLITAEIELLPEEDEASIDEEFEPMVDLLHQIINQLEPPYTTMPTHFDNAGWVSSRLIELLPLDLCEKQNFLKIENPYERLSQLSTRLDEKMFI
ncbi:MAG: LON peptidase substrate-binding domain-containing protein [Gammaproteobacteria bacterium]|nr:LON peptidase substrate-binding domain-containing protein [Gammaproteobacteria bacterium]MDH5777023.1 LON peptidase substrate-binding domain-containing protein [Gammaproteobacteria bacterium]